MRKLKDRPIHLPPAFGSIDKRDLNTVQYLDFPKVEQYLRRWLETTGSLSPSIPTHQTSDLVRPYFQELWEQDKTIDALLKSALMDDTLTSMLMGDHGAFLALPQSVQRMELSELFFRNLLTWLRYTYLHGSLKGSVEQAVEAFFHTEAGFDEWYWAWQQPYQTGHDISDQHGFEMTVGYEVDNPFQFSFESILLLGRLIRFVRPAHKIPYLMIRAIKKSWMDIKQKVQTDFWVNAFTDMSFGCCSNLGAYWELGDCSEEGSKSLCNPLKKPRVERDFLYLYTRKSGFGWHLGIPVEVGECREVCSIASSFSIRPDVVFHGAVIQPVDLSKVRIVGDSNEIQVRFDLVGNLGQGYSVSLESSLDHFNWVVETEEIATPGAVVLPFDSTAHYPFPGRLYLRLQIECPDGSIVVFDLPSVESKNGVPGYAPGALILGELSEALFEQGKVSSGFVTGSGLSQATTLCFRGDLGRLEVPLEILTSTRGWFEVSGDSLAPLVGGLFMGLGNYRELTVTLEGPGISSNPIKTVLKVLTEPVVTALSIVSLPSVFPQTVAVLGQHFSPTTRVKVSNQEKPVAWGGTPGSFEVSVEQSDVRWGQLSFSVIDSTLPGYESNVVILK